MTKSEEIRAFLDRVITEKKANYRQISLALGRGHQYIRQYIKLGSPLFLKEEERKIVAQILDIDEQSLSPNQLDLPYVPSHLTGVSRIADKIASMITKKDDVTIEMVDVTACCGNGIDNLSEQAYGYWKLPLSEFKSLATCNPKDVKMIKAQGDSMSPTINEGDFVWIDLSNNFISSDGVYLIKTHTGLSIKRIQSGLTNITVLSDNPIYKNEVTTMGEVQIVGKVVHVLNSRRI